MSIRKFIDSLLILIQIPLKNNPRLCVWSKKHTRKYLVNRRPFISKIFIILIISKNLQKFWNKIGCNSEFE